MIIIPARFQSTRFPGKPLAQIHGKSMIQRVYDQCIKTEIYTIVATDHPSIYDHVKSFGGEVMMTGDHHQSGTDRCAEVFFLQGGSAPFVINVQGDEPFIQPEQILAIKHLLVSEGAEIATLCKKITDHDSLFNEHVVKLVKGARQKALYFSRSPIPFFRGVPKDQWHLKHIYFRHIGIYGFTGKALAEVVAMQPGAMETVENLEQLRWLENGKLIHVAETDFQSPAIDTPEDLQRVIDLNLGAD